MAELRLLHFPALPQSSMPRTPTVDASGQYWTPGELTDREYEVLALAYLRNKEIAHVLGCSVATVKAHWRHINAKLGSSNRTEAVVMAMRNSNCSVLKAA